MKNIIDIATLYVSEYDGKRLLIVEIISAIMTSLLAVLFHFLFEWSGENVVVGLFSPINESIWEHTKILVFPFIIVSIIEYFLIDSQLKQFVFYKLACILLLPLMLITFFYTYSGIIGQNIILVDIISTFAYIFIAYCVSYKYIRKQILINKNKFIVLASLVVLLVIMELVFTNYPPELPLFAYF